MECQNQTLFVEPNLTFAERIARGNYGWTNSDLTEKKFSVTEDQHGEWEWKLFRFNRAISSENAIRLIKEDDFEPAQIGHILTFGEEYPEKQRKFPITGLGLLAEVNLGVEAVMLWSGRDGRQIDIAWFSLNSDWHSLYHHLGVRRPVGYAPA